MRHSKHKSMLGQRGAVLAEMALVTPFLLVLLLATIDLTKAFIEHNTLTKAVRGGVRYVAANAYEGTTGVVNVTATLADEARNLVVYGNTAPVGGTPPVLPGLTTADVFVTQIGASNDIEITVTHQITGLFGPFLPNFYGGPAVATTRNISATVRMRAL